MKKNIKSLLIIVIIVIIWLILAILSNKKDNNVEKYFISLGFTNYSNTSLYSKQISENNLEQHNNNVTEKIDSEYEVLYFNADTYQLTKDKITYSDGILKNFTPVFDYTNNKLTYTYRINFNNTNIIIGGIYNSDTKDFTCEPSFAYQINIGEAKNDICNKVKLDVEDFDFEAYTLIEDSKVINYMKQK